MKVSSSIQNDIAISMFLYKMNGNGFRIEIKNCNLNIEIYSYELKGFFFTFTNIIR